MDLRARPATMDDARRLLDWRNDPLARSMSFSSDVIDWPTHCAWLEATLASDTTELLVVEAGGEAAATIRYDDVEGEWQFSWNLAPEWRGRGVAIEVAKLICALKPGVVGLVKPDNIAAQKVCARAGMTLEIDADPQRWRCRCGP